MTWKPAIAARKAPPGLVTSVHFTETCDSDAPHLIVEVTSTAATTSDGDIVGELHERLAEERLLPHEHFMDAGYVDAEVLAQSQHRYQVDVVGPAMPEPPLGLKRSGTLRSEPVSHRLASQPGGLSRRTHAPRLAPDPRSPRKTRS